MSLEAAILENTSVLRELLARLTVVAIPTATPDTKVEVKKLDAPAASGQPTATAKKEAAAPESTTSAPNPAAQSAAPESQASTAATTITYDQVAKAITDGVKSSRDKVVAALAKFNAKKGTELKPDQYAAFLAELA